MYPCAPWEVFSDGKPVSMDADLVCWRRYHMKLLIRWAINALALFAAAWIIPGIRVDDGGGWVVYAVMAIILSLLNALVRPLLKLLTCPLILLTLGLFTLVIDAITLLLASRIATNVFNVGFFIDGFWPALWGAIIVSLVSVVLNILVDDDHEGRGRDRRNR
jgi:putative membrane protein